VLARRNTRHNTPSITPRIHPNITPGITPRITPSIHHPTIGRRSPTTDRRHLTITVLTIPSPIRHRRRKVLGLKALTHPTWALPATSVPTPHRTSLAKRHLHIDSSCLVLPNLDTRRHHLCKHHR
jgi:hypothetical protein